MANHTGYIFIAPNGTYLYRSHYVNQDSNNIMSLTSHLDMATLYPSKNLPIGEFDWNSVTEALSSQGYEGQVSKILTPLFAKSFQRIEILGIPIIGNSNEE